MAQGFVLNSLGSLVPGAGPFVISVLLLVTFPGAFPGVAPHHLGAPSFHQDLPDFRVKAQQSLVWGTVASTLDLYTGALYSGLRTLNMTAHYRPSGIVVDHQDGLLLVSTGWGGGPYPSGGSLLVNATTGQLRGTYSAGQTQAGKPAVNAYYPVKDEFFAVSGAKNAVVVIDAPTGKAVAAIPVGLDPEGATYDAANGNVYVTGQHHVTSSSTDQVTVINASSRKVVGSISVPQRAGPIAYDNRTGDIYVVTWFDICIINGTTNKVARLIPDSYFPSGLAVDTLNGNVYVTHVSALNVTIIDGVNRTAVGSIAVPNYANSAAFDDRNGFVYVNSCYFACLNVIDTSSNLRIASVVVGRAANGLAFDELGGKIYVADSSGMKVESLDPSHANVTATIEFPSINPTAESLRSAGTELFIANEGSNNVSLVNLSTGRLTGSISVGNDPICLQYDGPHHRLFVLDRGSANITIINTTSNAIVGAIRLHGFPLGMTLDRRDGLLYVLNESGVGNLSVTAISSSAGSIVSTTMLASGFGYAIHGYDGGTITMDVRDDLVYVAYGQRGCPGRSGSPCVVAVNGSSGHILRQTALATNQSLVSPVWFDQSNGRVYVAWGAYWDGWNLTEINASTGKVDGAIPIAYGGFRPSVFAGFAVNASSGYIYASDAIAGRIWVIDPVSGAVLGSFGVAVQPSALLYDPSTALLYVTVERPGALLSVRV